jgi:hypothetical protein
MKREIGRVHSLAVLEVSAHRVILDGGSSGPLALQRRDCPEELSAGESLAVFIYLEADGQPAATTRRPLAELGQVAWLKIVEINQLGAFADWGLEKDLFIPYAEQQQPLSVGRNALVRVYLDNQGRLAGSTRIDHWIADTSSTLKRGEKVRLIIADRTELGFKAVINHECWGLLYSTELYRRIRKGQQMDGFVQRIRDDGRIDLSVNQPGFSRGKMDEVSSKIIKALEENGGSLPLSDKSPPPEIYARFAVSKKVFKQAIGTLYKQRLIAIEDEGIRLL